LAFSYLGTFLFSKILVDVILNNYNSEFMFLIIGFLIPGLFGIVIDLKKEKKTPISIASGIIGFIVILAIAYFANGANNPFGF